MIQMVGPLSHPKSGSESLLVQGSQAPGEARVQRAGALGAWRLRLTSAPLSEGLHVHAAVHLTLRSPPSTPPPALRVLPVA